MGADVQRWCQSHNDSGDLEECGEGYYVLHSDYEKLRTRLAALEAVEKAAKKLAGFVDPTTLAMNRVVKGGVLWYGLTPEYVEGVREYHTALDAASDAARG